MKKQGIETESPALRQQGAGIKIEISESEMKMDKHIKRFIGLAAFFLAFGIFPLAGDVLTDSSMEFYNTVYRGENEWLYSASGIAGLTFQAPRNPQVQGQTEIEFYPQDLYGSPDANVPVLGVKKAYVRTRFPGLRLTLGKTRLAWGQGVVFNSGDILFGSRNPVVDLTRQELRSDTAWLTAVNIPMGNFAFAEAVVLPPSLYFESGRAGSVDMASAGGRVYFEAAGIKFEGGYLYKGENKVASDAIGHRPYVSFQGNMGPDWYLSSSLAIPSEKQERDEEPLADWKESWNMSFGLFHMQQIGRNHSLNMRLETLVFPYQNWEKQDRRDAVYGVYLYPELSWAAGSTMVYSLRSVFSVVDVSAMISGGLKWSVYQGLTLLGYVNASVGDKNATFAWDRADAFNSNLDAVNGISCMLGMGYRF